MNVILGGVYYISVLRSTSRVARASASWAAVLSVIVLVIKLRSRPIFFLVNRIITDRTVLESIFQYTFFSQEPFLLEHWGKNISLLMHGKSFQICFYLLMWRLMFHSRYTCFSSALRNVGRYCRMYDKNNTVVAKGILVAEPKGI